MPITYCLVPDCISAAPAYKLFSVPRTDALRDMWMDYIVPIAPSFRSIPRQKLIHYKICIKHFEAKYIVNGNQRLRHGVPTLFTKEEIESGIPTQPLKTEPKQMLNEHSYSYMKPREDHTYCKDADRELIDNLNLYVEETNTDCPAAADKDYGPSHPVHGITTDYNGFDDLITREDREVDSQEISTRSQKYNKVQLYMDEFVKEIEHEFLPLDTVCPHSEDTAPTGKFAAELEKHNLSAKVIDTNMCVKPYDTMEHLMNPEKAYAAITYCILKQQEFLEESVNDFLTWARNSVFDYESLKEKVTEIFVNGELVQISLKILQIVCKYRLKNVETRKEGIVNQLLDPEMKEALSNIPHTSSHLFDADVLMSTVHSVSTIYRLFVPKKSNLKQKSNKHDRGTQANILPQKASKHVQVKPKKARKVSKNVQVNSNELEGIATAKKVKKKDTGSQTSEKDRILGETMLYRDNLPLRERPENETVEDSPLNHCQKIQYVVKIKRKPPHTEGATNPIINQDRFEPNTQAGPEPTDYPQNISNDYNSKEMVTENRDTHQGPKKKRKTVKRAPDPSMPVIWDACQNLLSLGGSNITETEAETVHSTLERKTVTPKRPSRPHFGKKRRPKIPEGLKEQTSPMKSVGISPMQGTSDSSYLPGRSVDPMHVCDSPYLLGGCKHCYDPRTESVPPSSVQRGLNIQSSSYSPQIESIPPSNIRSSSYSGSSGGKLLRNALSQPRGSVYETEDPRNPNYQDQSVVVIPQNQITEETNQGNSTPMLLLTYDNLLSRWA
ncbi:hypothetical protein ABMA28_008667 [Loxostege sticticalis]|uniref:THAP-type domain-containing protein n=1 Tax=Loxostege sticticalis TaxID=481309 RepID=A0ABD0SEA1_LOXSC